METVGIQALLTSAGEAAPGGWPAWWGESSQLRVPEVLARGIAAGHVIRVCMSSMSSIFYSQGDQGSESQAMHFHSHSS